MACEALPEIDRDRILDLFCSLARCPSSSRQERQVADIVLDHLRRLGLDPLEDSAGAAIGGNTGNIVCQVPGHGVTDWPYKEPCLFLCAHLDTVPPTGSIDPKLENGHIRNASGGILGADDKAAVAALLTTVQALMEGCYPHPPFELIFTVAEETALSGAKHLDQEYPRSPFGAVFDASGPVGGIIVGAPGQNTIRATFTGVAAHAGVEPEKGRSAVQAAAKAVASMALGRLDPETTANVGIIRGGVARNIVPDQCYVEAETRSHDQEKLSTITAALVESLHLGAAEVGCDVRIEVVSEYRSYRLGPRQAVVRWAKTATRRCGLIPDLRIAGGGADANIFVERGIPTVNMATGMESMHTPDEFISIEDLARLPQLAFALIQSAPQYAPKPERRRKKS